VRRSGRNWREVTSSYDRIECRNASVHARSARRSRRHEMARAASQRQKACSKRPRCRRRSPQHLQVSAISTWYEQRFDGDSTTPGAPESPRGLPMAQSGLLLVMSKTCQYTATSSPKLLSDLTCSRTIQILWHLTPIIRCTCRHQCRKFQILEAKP